MHIHEDSQWQRRHSRIHSAARPPTLQQQLGHEFLSWSVSGELVAFVELVVVTVGTV